MFNKLTEFGLVRTGTQALGFYIVYLIIAIVVGGVAGGLGGLITGNVGDSAMVMQVGMQWGAAAAVVYSLLIGMIIVVQKKLGVGYILLALLGGLLALVGGGILGLIPAALMTTRPQPITIATGNE